MGDFYKLWPFLIVSFSYFSSHLVVSSDCDPSLSISYQLMKYHRCKRQGNAMLHVYSLRGERVSRKTARLLVDSRSSASPFPPTTIYPSWQSTRVPHFFAKSLLCYFCDQNLPLEVILLLELAVNCCSFWQSEAGPKSHRRGI